MLNYSDTDIAEGLGRQIALRSGLPATFAGAAAALSRRRPQLHLPGLGRSTTRAACRAVERDVAPRARRPCCADAAVGGRPELRALIRRPARSPDSAARSRARFTADAPAGAGPGPGQDRAGSTASSALAGVVTTADGRLLAFAALAPAPVRCGGRSGPGSAGRRPARRAAAADAARTLGE